MTDAERDLEKMIVDAVASDNSRSFPLHPGPMEKLAMELHGKWDFVVGDMPKKEEAQA